jgi:hypothetical protein
MADSYVRDGANNVTIRNNNLVVYLSDSLVKLDVLLTSCAIRANGDEAGEGEEGE